MAKRKSAPRKPPITFDDACGRLEELLASAARERILASALEGEGFAAALHRLGDGMRANRFQASGETISLERIVHRLDTLTRRDGFHVLHDWDGVAEQLLEQTIPVDVLEFVGRNPVPPGKERTVLAILLDYYFFYVLALAAMRVWDEGDGDADANANLDRVSRLLTELHGPNGSGQRFADDAETLILVATSHFESDDTAYDRLLDRIRTLDHGHRTSLALSHAAILASHLRFGFEATYARDVVKMRNDNVPDYPWLGFALATLMEAYERVPRVSEKRARLLESLLNGLTPDPRAFVGQLPAFLEPHAAEIGRFRELFRSRRDELLKAFAEFVPTDEAYSPIAFYFNFTHNLLKAIVVDALLRGEPWDLSVNALFTGVPQEPSGEARETLARTLMAYARASPDRIRGQLVPVIVYDPRKGRRAATTALEKL